MESYNATSETKGSAEATSITGTISRTSCISKFKVRAIQSGWNIIPKGIIEHLIVRGCDIGMVEPTLTVPCDQEKIMS
jgi:hypothetical protein